MSAQVLFITGTDTGVGKTLITALLLSHLRERGMHALAMKPFCSGSRDDVNLLQAIQKRELTDREMNPFYFREPLAPMVAARHEKRKEIAIEQVIESIQRIRTKCDWLLIEGAGGLLAPLAPKLTALDLIESLNCQVCVVAANRLGTLNHALLTLRALLLRVRRKTKVVLSRVSRRPDLSAETNHAVLSELLAPISVIPIPWLGVRAATAASVRKHASLLRPALQCIADS